MITVKVSAAADLDELEMVTVERPRPATGEVLIRVAAAGVNRADLMQRRGDYDPPPGVTEILGLEVAGTVAELGPGVDAAWLGREVCALLAGGGYAEFVTVPVVHVLPVPEGVSLVDAAGLLETAATVWSNLVDRGRLVAGETVLVHGGASGIGSTAIQFAKALGATVAATAGSEAKLEHCRQLGADLVIDYAREDFQEVLTGWGREIDVVVDVVGAPYVQRNLSVLTRGGRLVLIGLLGGSSGPIDLTPMLLKDLTVTGSGLRTKSVEAKARIVRAVGEQMWPLYGSGAMRPTTFTVLELDQAREAHRLLEDGTAAGKVVLRTSTHASTKAG